MVGHSKATGETTKCTVKAVLNGLMDGSMRVTIIMTRNMDSECFRGPMDESTKAIGKTVSNMEKAFM